MNAIPRFVSLIPLAGETFEYIGAGGDGYVAVPSGYYWPLGSHGRVSTAANSATQTMAAGHLLQVGDVVDLWRAGAKVVTGRTVQSRTSTTVGLSASVNAQVGDRLVAQGDLLGTLEALMAEYDENARVSLDVGGRARLTAAAAGSHTIYWDGTELLTSLRLPESGAITQFDQSSPAVASRPPLGSLYPSLPLTDEHESSTREREEYEADDGTLRVQTIARVRHMAVTIRFTGEPRASTLTERDDVAGFIHHAGQGYRFRYYPDRDVHAPYNRVAEPWGYEEWLLRSPTGFDPAEVVRRRRDLGELAIRMQRYVG